MNSDIRYTGHYYHANSGLTLAPYRAYEPTLGRWLNRDPIGEAGGINLYGYVQNNPVNLIDLLGFAPGDSYATLRDAAIAALCEINPQSIADNKEFSGAIYTPNNGASFSYTSAKSTGGTDYSPLVIPSQGSWVGMYHTHGAYDSRPEYTNNPNDPGVDRNTNFSIFPDGTGDIPTADQWGRPSYMVDPRNTLHLYDPNWSPKEKKKRGRKGEILGKCPCKNN